MLSFYPFKFNPTWFSVEGFNSLVHSSWMALYLEAPAHLSTMQAFLFKLAKLHSSVCNWEKEMKRLENIALVSIEKEISFMDENIGVDYFCYDRSDHIKEIFQKRQIILDHKAETLRQKK